MAGNQPKERIQQSQHGELLESSIMDVPWFTASVVWWLACWPLVPQFAGSIPTEAVGFFSDVKKSSACLPSEGK
jgi:hypothetical protein